MNDPAIDDPIRRRFLNVDVLEWQTYPSRSVCSAEKRKLWVYDFYKIDFLHLLVVVAISYFLA